MKRKYFSALLMGALTIASVSTFTSCKDYDDDISNLQQQIDSNAKAIGGYFIKNIRKIAFFEKKMLKNLQVSKKILIFAA